jgi:HEPN domain-containing protein
MRPNEHGESKRWLKQAKQDLDDAVFNLSGKRFNVACFLAQQSAEKSLKAYLYAKGAEEVWGHSVAELCQDATQFEQVFKEWRIKLAPLDKYYIPTRYPNALPGGIPSKAFDEDDAKRAITSAKHIIKFICGKLRT